MNLIAKVSLFAKSFQGFMTPQFNVSVPKKMKTIILPGMGANSNMYPKDKYKLLQNVKFIDWPKYEGEISLDSVAIKLIEQHQINKKIAIGGSSLGGMVAIEIAKITGIKKVILIGSATNPNYINPLLQKLSNLADVTPVKIIQALTGKLNHYASNEMLSMFEHSDSKFIKAMCKALVNWEGLGNLNCEVNQIHGEKDLVIFPPNNNAEIIPNGGHLIAMSHPEEVVDFINKFLH